MVAGSLGNESYERLSTLRTPNVDRSFPVAASAAFNELIYQVCYCTMQVI